MNGVEITRIYERLNQRRVCKPTSLRLSCLKFIPVVHVDMAAGLTQKSGRPSIEYI